MTRIEMSRVIFGLGIDSTNCLERILEFAKVNDAADAVQLFAYGWSGCDSTWHWQDELRAWLKSVHHIDFAEFLEPDSRLWFEGLPETLEIWRGCSRGREHGLSWTVSRHIALSFTKGHRGIPVPNPVLLRAKVAKSKILFATNDREEEEVLVDFGDIGGASHDSVD